MNELYIKIPYTFSLLLRGDKKLYYGTVLKDGKFKHCHSERSEESRAFAIFGFFTSLRFVQNDTYKSFFNRVCVLFLFTIILIFANFSFLSAQGNNDYNSCFEQVVKKYSDMKSISFKFKSPDNPDMKGKLSAEKGNKYQLELQDRTIVCDGKTLWNYSRFDKKVIITNFEEGNNASSIEQFFFNFLQAYKPVSLAEENSSNGRKSQVLKLIPKGKENSGIKYMNLFLSQNYDIQSVSFFDGKRTQTWDVSDVLLNKKFPKKYFEFTPPEKTSVIDLR